MPPNDQGRHCMACAKTVVDFTEKTKEEIVDHLQKADEQVCGRMRKSQLVSPTDAKPKPQQKGNWTWWIAKAAAFGVLSMINSTDLNAEVTMVDANLCNVTLVTTGVINGMVSGDVTSNDEGQSIWFTGTVLDIETGLPIPFANVVVEGSSAISSTDLHGYYVISLEEKLILRGSVLVEVSSIAYRSQKRRVSIDASTHTYELPEILLEHKGTRPTVIVKNGDGGNRYSNDVVIRRDTLNKIWKR